MCEQNRTGSEDWDMKQNDEFGFGNGSMMEVIDVLIGAEASNDGGTWRCGDGVQKRLAIAQEREQISSKLAKKDL